MQPHSQNTDIVCSVLIPSRKRINLLNKALHSINKSFDPSRVEIIIRVDNDDYDTISRFWQMPNNVRMLTGNRYNGWFSHNIFYDEMARLALGRWIMIFNDDATIESSNLDEKLDKIPITKTILYPDIHILGGSTYPNDLNGPFPLFPNKCWTEYGINPLPVNLDVELPLMLEKHGWKRRTIDGMTVRHNRASDSELKGHRELRN